MGRDYSSYKGASVPLANMDRPKQELGLKGKLLSISNDVEEIKNICRIIREALSYRIEEMVKEIGPSEKIALDEMNIHSLTDHIQNELVQVRVIFNDIKSIL